MGGAPLEGDSGAVTLQAEEEFIAEILDLDRELAKLNEEAHLLEGIISHNIKQLAGD